MTIKTSTRNEVTREYRRGLWAGLVVGLTVGASLVGFALLVGIGIGGTL